MAMDDGTYFQQVLFGGKPFDVSKIKQCDKCYKHLPYHAFDKDPTTKDGYDHRCKECKSDEALLRKQRKSMEFEYNKTLRCGG